MRWLKKSMLAGAVLALAACNDILGESDGTFTFDVSALTYNETVVDTAEAAALINSVQIDGVIVLPHACHDLVPRHQRSGGRITVTVRANPTNPSCPAAMSALQYQLLSFGVSRGIYRVQVWHELPAQQPVLISQTDVTVN
jgi:hypothetical protein